MGTEKGPKAALCCQLMPSHSKNVIAGKCDVPVKGGDQRVINFNNPASAYIKAGLII
jgi:hypothetical protein